MTLGEKLKLARKQIGLSQEQLAMKINVSRSAIAKWETDKGIPDVENLKQIAQILNVSIDYLLDDNQSFHRFVMKETIDLSKYKGSRKKKKDKMIREKYPNAEIYTLLGEVILTKYEKIVDNVIGVFTSAPFGIPDFINGVKNIDKEFYLVNQKEKQFFVVVSNEYVESYELVEKINKKKFILENRQFINCGTIK